MNSEIRDRITAESQKSKQQLEQAKQALARGDRETFETALRSGILHRFLISGLETGTEQLEALAEISIHHISAMTGGDLEAAGVITGCGSETSGLLKKVQLLIALQKELGVQIQPAHSPDIKTIDDLAEEIFAQRAGKPACAEPGSAGDPESRRIAELRQDFPILDTTVFLDNASTMQTPKWVREEVNAFCDSSYSNVHRSVHGLGDRATERFEMARRRIAVAIGAEPEEVIFTSGTTMGLNMAALSLEPQISCGDRIVTTDMEHHSNYLPWLELSRRTGASFASVPLLPSGELNLEKLEELLAPPTRILAFTHCSNVLGVENDIAAICARARAHGVITVVDGAQGIRHSLPDLKNAGCSMYAFSGHKTMSLNGIGVLYIRKELQRRLRPPFFGGGMIKSLHDGRMTINPSPYGWEAGTPNIVGVISLDRAFAYRKQLGQAWIDQREAMLMDTLSSELEQIKDVAVIGSTAHRKGCISFNVTGKKPQDVAGILGLKGINVRAGHHCTIPLHKGFGLTGSIRVSPAFYNTVPEICDLISAVKEIAKM